MFSSESCGVPKSLVFVIRIAVVGKIAARVPAQATREGASAPCRPLEENPAGGVWVGGCVGVWCVGVWVWVWVWCVVCVVCCVGGVAKEAKGGGQHSHSALADRIGR